MLNAKGSNTIWNESPWKIALVENLFEILISKILFGSVHI